MCLPAHYNWRVLSSAYRISGIQFVRSPCSYKRLLVCLRLGEYAEARMRMTNSSIDHCRRKGDFMSDTAASQGFQPPQPGAEHAVFKKDVGTWDAAVEIRLAPGVPAQTS